MSGLTAERNIKILQELLKEPGNDVCADCGAPAPRWAAWNLGIFLCVTCCSIHRRLHCSKVKSITMDSWTREQIETMRQIGNVKSNLKYNPNELKHPPPTNLMDGERGSELEKYIRAKYEFKTFMERSTPTPDPSRSASVPLVQSNTTSKPLAAGNLNPPRTLPTRSVSQPVQPPLSQQTRPQAVPPPAQRQQPIAGASKEGVWADLISLQNSTSSSLPLQYQTPQHQPTFTMPPNPTPQIPNLNSSPSPAMISFNPNVYQPQLMIPTNSSLTPTFPSAGMPPSPLTYQSLQTSVQPQFSMMQAPVVQPLPQNTFIGLQQPLTQMNGQFVLPPSPQPIVTGGQFLTPSPQPQVFNPQFTQPGSWPPSGSPMQGQGWGQM